MKNNLNFDYPFLSGWNKDEIIKVSSFYSAVAEAYEGGISVEQLLMTYHDFKMVVTSKSEEKQLDRQFKEKSKYSIYKTIQAAKETSKKILIMEN